MKWFLAVMLYCLSLPIFASDAANNLTGNYDCHGTEVDSSDKFTCTMKLEKTGQTYLLKSACSDGSSYMGTGIYDPNKRNLSFVFVNPKKAAETGVIAVDVKEDDSMTSTWTYLYNENVGHGACKKAHFTPSS